MAKQTKPKPKTKLQVKRSPVEKKPKTCHRIARAFTVIPEDGQPDVWPEIQRWISTFTAKPKTYGKVDHQGVSHVLRKIELTDNGNPEKPIRCVIGEVGAPSYKSAFDDTYNKDGHPKEIPLEEEDGIGPACGFLYEPATGILLIESGANGFHDVSWVALMRQVVKIHFQEPVVIPDAQKLQTIVAAKGGVLRKAEIRIHDPIDSTVSETLVQRKTLKQVQPSVLTVGYSLRRGSKGALLLDGVQTLLNKVAPGLCPEKGDGIKISYAASDATRTHVLNLLDVASTCALEGKMLGRRRIYEYRKNELIAAFFSEREKLLARANA